MSQVKKLNLPLSVNVVHLVILVTQLFAILLKFLKIILITEMLTINALFKKCNITAIIIN